MSLFDFWRDMMEPGAATPEERREFVLHAVLTATMVVAISAIIVAALPQEQTIVHLRLVKS